MSDSGNYLESSLPASIDIEEMLVGRLTARQLAYVFFGGAIIYNFGFKMPNPYLGWSLAGVVAIAIYFFGFFKIKKYDRYLSEHAMFYFKYKREQQVFLGKK